MLERIGFLECLEGEKNTRKFEPCLVLVRLVSLFLGCGYIDKIKHGIV